MESRAFRLQRLMKVTLHTPCRVIGVNCLSMRLLLVIIDLVLESGEVIKDMQHSALKLIVVPFNLIYHFDSFFQRLL